ncbi:MAG: cupredoxin domain-containing protein [Tepidiformaceae bacterium]
MDDHSSDNKEHSEVHLPDPSIWPLVIGFASLLAGLALVFWVRDRGSNPFAGPVLGIAVLFVLLSVFGWAYQDGVMKRKAETRTRSTSRDARFTQVVTFAVAEGRIDAARSSGGVLSAIEGTDGAFHDLAGFQDLRIIVAPASDGPSQVLVETTWSNREGLATYEETRQTLLDLVTAHPDDVVTGSVQVFDMQVIRDTKDVAFRFGIGAAATVLGSLVIGGFMIGAGLNLFAQNSEAASSGSPSATAPAANPDALTVVATDDKFDTSTLTAPANTKITVTLQNNGAAKHNIAFLQKKDGDPLSADSGSPDTAVNGGSSGTITFTTPGPGTYYFECEFHPTQMFGTFTVTAAPAGGAAPGGGAAAPGTLDVSLTDDKIDKSTLTAKAGTPVTVKVTNNGQSKHNLDFLTAKGGTSLASAAGNDSTFLNAGDSETLTFTVDKPGTYYYQCDLHPDQMFGTFTVT